MTAAGARALITTLELMAALLWSVERGQERMEKMLRTILRKEDSIMAGQADIEAAVADETTVIGGVVTLLDQLHQMLTDAIGDPAATQRVLDMIAANKAALADAVARNTPAA